VAPLTRCRCTTRGASGGWSRTHLSAVAPMGRQVTPRELPVLRSGLLVCGAGGTARRGTVGERYGVDVMDERGGELRIGRRQGQVVRAHPSPARAPTTPSEGPEDPGRDAAHAPPLQSITTGRHQTPKPLRALCAAPAIPQISGLRSRQGALGGPAAPHAPALASYPCVLAGRSTCASSGRSPGAVAVVTSF